MRRVNSVALVSSTAAPILLTLGMAVAANAHPSYDHLRQTVSELAALDQPFSLAMGLGFAAAGLFLILTAWQSPGLRLLARRLLALAGLAILAVAALPLPTMDSDFLPHRLAGVCAFLMLAFWPLTAMVKNSEDWALHPHFLLAPTVVNLVCTFGFFIAWFTESGISGLLERIIIALDLLIPTFIVHSLWHLDRHPAATAYSRTPNLGK